MSGDMLQIGIVVLGVITCLILIFEGPLEKVLQQGSWSAVFGGTVIVAISFLLVIVGVTAFHR